MEPYRIKCVENIKITTEQYREDVLKKSHYNLFQIKADEVTIDLLTDSGTSAMSAEQWAAMMLGDESYAGSGSFYKLEKVVKDITGHRFFIPTHQGRAAEDIVFGALVKEGTFCISNTFFDTTRGNVESRGAVAIDLLQNSSQLTKEKAPFKGNISTRKLEKIIEDKGPQNCSLVVLTVTNNSAAGQPVSMANIRETSDICRKNGVPFILDACRFAENAYFIKRRERGYEHKTIWEIVHEMFSYADGSTMSAKKDGLSNIGGWITLNDIDIVTHCKDSMVLTEGFPTYGGLSGRDIEIVAQGVQEVLSEQYLENRIKTVQFLADKLTDYGVPIVEPPGGHAVYIDAKRFAPHIPPHRFPGQAIACKIYAKGGIRTCEIGSLMFGKSSRDELVRLAIPRRVYTKSHLEYVAKIIADVYENSNELVGFSITYEPKVLRHFNAHLEPVSLNGLEQNNEINAYL